MKQPESRCVICFGEVLWDVFPTSEKPGGAPLNVAYHVRQHGLESAILSSVGDDEAGEKLLDVLAKWGVDSTYISRLRDTATGTVVVSLDRGEPTYSITENVAWDRIDVWNVSNVPTPSALVYGSLAQRSSENRRALSCLLAEFPSALKVFDVNLRFPFVDRDHVLKLGEQADLIKVNNEEALYLLGPSHSQQTLKQQAQALADRLDCTYVCVTSGAKGSGLLHNKQWLWVDGKPVDVADTVGAGDAFLASLITGLLVSPIELERNLTAASELASLVASKRGATPSYRIGDDGALYAN